ncbi:hypothetical protein F3J23_09660 [Chryseobacterium sp. Tr-659]|uniref:hypothetical protein n=1 Tax=Chryseobacterium sp. Tr-659 TaxID=2608340 RepID=UPI0014237710|nr:hypothetical protein [Chryseobacterium sp. Tr-659]NIF05711.1 hypothetical protein [Chryseobacterium sp. Tr-659]
MDVKNNLLIVMLSLLATSCARKEVSMDIDQPFYANKKQHHISIDNNTGNNYVFYSINNVGETNYSLTGRYNVIIKDASDKEVKSKDIFVNISGSPYTRKDTIAMNSEKKKGFDRDLFWHSNNREMKEKAVFVKPFSKEQLERRFSLLISQMSSTGGYYDLKKKQKYTLQLEVSFDSTEIKKQLTPSDLDSLQKNHIKIFHGKLTTRKVPLIVE